MKVFTRKSFMFGLVMGALLVTGALFATGHLTLDSITHTEQVNYTYTTYDGLSFK